MELQDAPARAVVPVSGTCMDVSVVVGIVDVRLLAVGGHRISRKVTVSIGKGL